MALSFRSFSKQFVGFMMMAAVLCLSVFAMTSYAGAVSVSTNGVNVTFGTPYFSQTPYFEYLNNEYEMLDTSVVLDASFNDVIYNGDYTDDDNEFELSTCYPYFHIIVPVTFDQNISSLEFDSSSVDFISPAFKLTSSITFDESTIESASILTSSVILAHSTNESGYWENCALDLSVSYNVAVPTGSYAMLEVVDGTIDLSNFSITSWSSDLDEGEGELMGTDMDQLLQDTRTVASTTLSVVSSTVATITDNPFLLMTAGLLLLGAAIGILRRLLNRG